MPYPCPVEVVVNIFELLDMQTDEVVASVGGGSILVGRDHDGRQYIAVPAPCAPRSRRWLCAAISSRALDCVLSGNADLGDALRHTLTGQLEIVTLGPGGRLSETIVLCADLPDEAFAGVGRDLSLVA